MIHVAGSVSRSFIFPAPWEIAAEYYRDFNRVVRHLSLISMVKQLDEDKFRVMYNSVELGVYNIKIYCDVHTIFDENQRVLVVQTTDDHPKLPTRSGWNSSEAHGAFAQRRIRAEGLEGRVFRRNPTPIFLDRCKLPQVRLLLRAFDRSEDRPSWLAAATIALVRGLGCNRDWQRPNDLLSRLSPHLFD